MAEEQTTAPEVQSEPTTQEPSFVSSLPEDLQNYKHTHRMAHPAYGG